MSRVFAYCRVSREDLATENQVLEIRGAGFAVEEHRVVEETVSGSVPASQREGFSRLIDRMERSDVLVVSRLCRLGRNLIDVVSTVDKLAAAGIRVHCLQLGGADLTSPAGRLTMNVLVACAQFERDLLIERTQSGLRRAKAEGKKLGRRAALDGEQKAEVRAAAAEGAKIAALARQYGTSRQTIQRTLREAAA